jgi:hypothetical protein
MVSREADKGSEGGNGSPPRHKGTKGNGQDKAAGFMRKWLISRISECGIRSFRMGTEN